MLGVATVQEKKKNKLAREETIKSGGMRARRLKKPGTPAED